MNVERLLAIAKQVQKTLLEENTVQYFNQFIAAIQSVINEPQNTQHQQTLNDRYKQLLAALENSKSNHFYPAWYSVLADMNAADLFGLGLKEEIETIFTRNQITLGIALEELRRIQNRLTQFQESLDQLTKSLKSLNIESDDLEAGKCEIGIIIPRKYVHNELRDFSRELAKIDKYLLVFTEIATGARQDFEIRSIASSDLTVYLCAGIFVCHIISGAMDSLTSIYNNILNIRLKHHELKELGIKESLKPLGTEIEKIVSKKIEALRDELIKNCNPNINTHRKNELKNELLKSLEELANRIDRGFKIEIKVGPIPPVDDPENMTEENKKILQRVQDIQAAAERILFFENDNDSILSLPGWEEDENEDESENEEKTVNTIKTDKDKKK